MSNGSSPTTIYLAPYEVFLYSPYKTPTKTCTGALTTWRTVTMTEGAVKMDRPDAEREAVQAWLEQVIRRQLGAALSKAERRLKMKLSLPMSVPMASLISEALKSATGDKPHRSEKRPR